MRRRDFLTMSISATGALCPAITIAQPGDRIRRIGVLVPFAANDAVFRQFETAFVDGLARLGWIEGRNIRIDYRHAAGNPTLFQTYAAELVGHGPDTILASTLPAVAALQQQTHTVPIVFVLMPDPVGLGFVQSLAHPGGNLTGFSAYDTQVFEKWLQFLKEIAPGVERVAVIFNPDVVAGRYVELFNQAIEAVAPALGVTVTLTPVHDDATIEGAIAAQAREAGGGLITLPDPFVAAHHEAIIAAAGRHRMPLMGLAGIFPHAGGLMSYGFDPIEMHAQAASYIDRILRGANPAELPVQQPTRYELVINLKTAKALGLTVPQSLLARADEVIE